MRECIVTRGCDFMIQNRLGDALAAIRKQVALQEADGVSDRALLDAFVCTKDGSAFETLLHRHGAMVLNVCRRMLRHSHDAEDACQATFLILAQKASAIRQRDTVAAWLHGVAYHVAQRLRRDIARRDRHSFPARDVVQGDTTGSIIWRDAQRVIDEELNRLPDHYRAPLLLCYLEGKTQDEAARQLGWTDAVLRGRLDRGRERLRRRLLRRGVSLPAALFGIALTAKTAESTLPALLAVSTIKAAGILTAGSTIASCPVSAQVIALTQHVLAAMAMSKVKIAAAVLLIASCIGPGIVALTNATRSGEIPGPGFGDSTFVHHESPVKRENRSSTNTDSLLGSWMVIKRGDKQGFDRITFTTDRLLLHYGAQTMPPCKYSLDSHATPKGIDIYGAAGANTVGYRCIYRLDGTELDLAIGTPTRRPQSFEEARKEGQHVLLRREPEAVEEQKLTKKKANVGKNVYVEMEGNKAVRVLIQSHVCLRDGLLEQLLCRKGKKEHEAVLAADVDAREVHTALLLAGAEVGRPVQFQPKPVAPSGTRVKISVEYPSADGTTVREPAQRWIRSIPSKKDLAHDWVFAGSGFALDPVDPTVLHYRANDGDIICVANFESALLDLPVMSSNENANLAFEAHTERIPPLGTAVLVTLEPQVGQK
jgi:RNA polymerase sigma factor (sigma-70 family)